MIPSMKKYFAFHDTPEFFWEKIDGEVSIGSNYNNGRCIFHSYWNIEATYIFVSL